MKVIFLDIEGVLITSRKVRAEGMVDPGITVDQDIFDKIAVQNLNRLLKETGAKIVVSSFWRMGIPKANLILMLKLAGIKNPPIIDVTPFVWDKELKRTNRGKEILEWLEKNPFVDEYIVIDDCGYENLHGIPPERYIHTTLSSGFGSDEVYKKAVEVLST